MNGVENLARCSLDVFQALAQQLRVAAVRANIILSGGAGVESDRNAYDKADRLGFGPRAKQFTQGAIRINRLNLRHEAKLRIVILDRRREFYLDRGVAADELFGLLFPEYLDAPPPLIMKLNDRQARRINGG